MRALRILLPLAAVAALAAGALWLGPGRGAESRAPAWRTAEASRGDIVQTVSANGTLNPVVLVNVGTQISGIIRRIHTDFNQPVNSGDILAELDPALIRANIAELEANLASAQANIALAETRQARNRSLVERGFVVRSLLDDDQQSLAAARAQARALEARLAKERTNLSYTVIRAPIDGVVVARSVDVGQTVAASFQTPTLFQIAGNLDQMQIDTAVSEADVGAIRVGQRASFSVDAHPGRSFEARVRQIRLSPKIDQNVVTYNVVLATDNSQRLLLPGMTAQARIELARADAVLRIPNAALRFEPPPAAGETPAEAPGERRAPKALPVADSQQTRPARVWRLGADGQPQPLSIEIGIADERFTELRGGLEAGTPLVVGQAPAGRGPEPSRGGSFRMRLY